MNETTTVAGTIEHLNPHTLTIETNVRPSAPITPAFIQSIKENGVLTPSSATAATTAPSPSGQDSVESSPHANPDSPAFPSTWWMRTG